MTLSGLFVPLVTPFAADGGLDLPALERLAGHVLDAGATGIVALGTTGEPGALTPAEHGAVIDRMAGVCADRGAPLIVGASGRPVLLALAQHPCVTAALCTVPPFVRPGEEGVVAYFDSVAAASPVPVVIYHVPYRTGQALSASTLLRLAALPNVDGMKYSAGAIDADTTELLAHVPPGFSILGGDDAIISGSPGMSVGHPERILARSWGSWRVIGPQVSITRARAASAL